MPRVPMPPFDVRQNEGGVYDACGLTYGVEGGAPFYETRREPVGAGSVIFPADPSNLRQTLTHGNRTIAFPETGVPLLFARGAAGTADRFVPLVAYNSVADDGAVTSHQFDTSRRYMGVVHNNYIYIVDRRSLATWRMSALDTTPPVQTIAQLGSALTEALTHDLVSAIESWQGRIWLAVGNGLYWSATQIPEGGDLNFEAVGTSNDDPLAFIDSNAGYQVFDSELDIQGLLRHNDQFLVFGNEFTYATRAVDAGIQFAFREIQTELHYDGGAVSTRGGVLFWTTDGLYRLGQAGGDPTAKLSENIQSRLDQLTGDRGRIWPIVVDDAVFFFFQNSPYFVAFDLRYGTTTMGDCGDTRNKVPFLAAREAFTIGTMTDTLSAYAQPIGELGPNSERFEPLVIGFLAGSSDETLYRFENPPNPALKARLSLSPGGRRVHVRSASVRALGEWRLRFKESESNNWGGYKTPDRAGLVRLGGRPFRNLDVEVSLVQPAGGSRKRRIWSMDLEVALGGR